MLKSAGFYDYAWNPVEGCEHGCEYCYARADLKAQGKCFRPQFYPERLDEPRKVKPCRIFATHYTDLMGNFIPETWVQKVIDVCLELPNHTFYIITKNPVRYRDFEWPDNCVLGVTMTSEKDWYKAELMQYIKHRQMASIEPLLGGFPGYDFSQFELVVVGAMIGKFVRVKSDWLMSIVHDNIYYKPNIRKYLK